MSMDTGLQDVFTRIGEEFKASRLEPMLGHNVGLIGASGTASNSTYSDYDAVSGPTRSYDSKGPVAWANIFLGHRLRIQYNLGVNGAEPDDIVTQATTLAGGPVLVDYCILGWDWSNGITNSGENSTTTIGHLTTAINTLHDAGIKIILCSILPRTDANTSGEKQAIFETNNWMRLQGYRKGITFIDTASAIIDPTGTDPRTGYTVDGVHPNTLGAMAIGRVIAEGLAPLVAGSRRILHTNGDTRLITANPMMTGTGGTKGSGVTGSIADSWTASYVGTAATVTASKISRGDGSYWQQLALTSGSTGSLWLYAGSVGGTWSVGDQVIAECEFETDDDWNTVTHFYMGLGFTGAPGAAAFDVYQTESSPPTMLNPVEGVLQTPPINVPASTTLVVPAFIIKGTGGTVRISRFGVRKVG